MKILVAFGTRPEAIKLCPLVQKLRQNTTFSVEICVTGQHRGMLDQVLKLFAIVPTYDLNVMQPNQTLAGLTSSILANLDPILKSSSPDALIVQGDTTTTLAAALAAFYNRIPVIHVEAGLRTGDLQRPFPEEINRVLVTRLAALHFAPTATAADLLVAEGVSRNAISISGNTGIDSVLWVLDAIETGQLKRPEWPWLDANRKLLLVTIHRRENFGHELHGVIQALATLARREDVQIAIPVHHNPNVSRPIHEMLGTTPNVHLLEPLSYECFVDLMRQSCFILTDSGGVQEEAPSLGKPVLVLRDKTERPEAVVAGTARLVGTSTQIILREAKLLLDDPKEFKARTRVHNPYGDGTACDTIVSILSEHTF